MPIKLTCSVGEGNAGEDGLVLEQQLIASQVFAQRQDQSAAATLIDRATPEPGLRGTEAALNQIAGACCGQHEQAGYQAGDDGQCQQPAG